MKRLFDIKIFTMPGVWRIEFGKYPPKWMINSEDIEPFYFFRIGPIEVRI